MLQIHSMVPGIRWPAIPNERASQLLAVQYQLEQSQWLSPSEIHQQQQCQLAALLEHAYATVPFYRERFDRLGIRPHDLLAPNVWSKWPLLTRRDLQTHGASITCPLGPKEHGEITQAMTSGSCGEPIVAIGNSVTRLMFSALLLRQHLWHRRDFSLKLASIRVMRPTPESPIEMQFDGWGPATQGIVNTGPAVVMDIHTSIAEQADFLIRHDPDYLLTYPSVVNALARHFSRSSAQLTRLREVRTFGEVLHPYVRQACRDAWGVPVVDSYSAEELGEIASQCPSHECYHVQSENVILEVLDANGLPCPPGMQGRVVLTSLQNFAMPLIRYEIGDFAVPGEPCDCGRGLPVLRRIVGRERNLFLLPDGRQVWPTPEVQPAADNFPPIYQYQLIQKSRTDLELLVVAPRPFTEGELSTIKYWIANMLAPGLALTVTYVPSIPRGRTGKYEDFVSQLG